VCANTNHVLAERSNGNLACVSERTAEKMSWNIVETFEETVQINYDFPLSSKDYPEKSINSSPTFWSTIPEITFSAFPKVGETSEITATFTSDMLTNQDVEFEKRLFFSKNFEIVESNGTVEEIENGYVIKDTFTVLENTIKSEESLEVTVKAVNDGEAMIQAIIEDATQTVELFVDSNQTLFLEDYYEMNPNAMTALEVVTEYVPEEKTTSTTSETTSQSTLDSTSTELQIPAPFVDAEVDPQTYVDRYFSDVEYKEWFDTNHSEYDSIYQAVGLDEPLETQGFSPSLYFSLPFAYAQTQPTFFMKGYITNDPSNFDTGSNAVYGITVCASDKRDDGIRLDDKFGKKVFSQEAKAAKKLMQILKQVDQASSSEYDDETDDEGDDNDSDNTVHLLAMNQGFKDSVQTIIDDMVDLDSRFAEISVNEANAVLSILESDPNTSDKLLKKIQKQIDRMNKELQKAQEKLDEDKYDKSILHYKKAWSAAEKAIKIGT
ncbi:MAG: hypothetical protein J4F36_06060, partial [Nitrosopumilaceae archaeon]|nr:hypothetical protein [Nitrosopumilaceae archaeon]